MAEKKLDLKAMALKCITNLKIEPLLPLYPQIKINILRLNDDKEMVIVLHDGRKYVITDYKELSAKTIGVKGT